MEVRFQPLDSALEYIRRKTPVTSPLRHDGWEQVALGLRDRALWSAAVESARMVAFMRERFEDVLAGHRTPAGTVRDRSEFVRDWMALARGEGVSGPGPEGGVADIASEVRARLVYETNIQQAYGYAHHVSGQDPDALEAAPALELIRLEERRQKRVWHERWRAAGGRIFPGPGRLGDGREGRLIALRTDPVWAAVSRFGTPWPPFDFNSGTWVEEVLRPEAEALGLLARGAPAPAPNLPDFNAGLEAGVQGLGPEELTWLRAQFGDQILIDQGMARWQGGVIGQLYDAVLAGAPAREVRLGAATAQVIGATGGALEGHYLALRPDDIRHALRRHGEAGALGQRSPGEQDPAQRPLRRLDFELLPHVWRDPDSVEPGTKRGAWEFRKRLVGLSVAVGWQQDPQQRRLFVNSMWVKREAGAGH